MSRITKYILGIPVVFIATGIFFSSCVNDLDNIKQITSLENAPDEYSANLHVIYTDSGLAKVELEATIAESYHTQKKTKLKDGLKVQFFDDLGKVSSILTALYGEIDEVSGDMFVRDSVELFNIGKQKVLQTEELYWNKAGDSIYTDKSVVIKSPQFNIYGLGARTTQSFDTAYIYKSRVDIKK